MPLKAEISPTPGALAGLRLNIMGATLRSGASWFRICRATDRGYDPRVRWLLSLRADGPGRGSAGTHDRAVDAEQLDVDQPLGFEPRLEAFEHPIDQAGLAE